jgi:hypothetical protein
MKTIPLLGLIFGLAGAIMLVLPAASQPTNSVSENDRDLSQKISEILRECEKIKPGMTRADLLKTFKKQGGISTRTHQTFVYRGCLYVKVDVEFEVKTPEPNTADKPQDETTHETLGKKPTDVIKKISQPYLQWAVID